MDSVGCTRDVAAWGGPIGSEVSFLLNGKKRPGVVTASKGHLVKIEHNTGTGVVRQGQYVRGRTSVWVPTKEVSARSSAASAAATRLRSPGELTAPRVGGASSAAENALTKQGHMDIVRGSNAVAKSSDYISGASYMQNALSVVVVGASGDLAKKKTYPALLDLFAHGHLPLHVNVVGIARSALTDEALRSKLRPFLEKMAGIDADLIEHFLQRCVYRKMASYSDAAAMSALHAELLSKEAASGLPGNDGNRLFYFAIPPNVFLDTAATIKATCEAPAPGFTRLIVEKPFGHDFESATELAAAMGAIYPEEQLYRIDHYLGKEMVQNMIVMRFGNVFFERVWDNRSISSVQITFKEDFGTMGRGGYFDNYGIIRDILQNHLMQVLALVAMERPAAVFGPDASTAVRDAKVALIRKIRPIALENVVLGQYSADPAGREVGYTEDPTVPNDSRTPTFAVAVLFIDDERWAGVPFIMRAGKALDARKAEVRIQLKEPAGIDRTFNGQECPRNELVIRLQPDEAMYIKANVKAPGLHSEPQQVELDLSYKERFYTGTSAVYSPDAYTRLLLDVLTGKQSAFVRDDELLASWAIWDPLLKQIEAKGAPVPVHPYVYGSRGPKQAAALIEKYGYQRNAGYAWKKGGNL